MPGRWDWTRSNGGASDAQTRTAYASVTNRGRTYDFSHFVWNDLVENTYSLLVLNGKEWDSAVLSYEDTLIEADGILTADRFNSLRRNIRDTGWPWVYNEARPDYIGRYNVHVKDKVFGSYILELAHKYNVMFGIFDDTAGNEMTLLSETDIGIPAEIYMICVRGILVGLLLDTDVTAELAADLIPFAPTLLEAAIRTNIQTENVVAGDIVLFALPEIESDTSENTLNDLQAIAVNVPAREVSNTFFLKTMERLSLDDESSDDMEMICSDVLGLTSAVLKLTKLRSYRISGAVWRSDVSSRRTFSATFARTVLASIGGMRSNVGTSFGFSAKVTTATQMTTGRMRSDISTEASFSGWWCDVKPVSIGRLRSYISSAASFVLRTCEERFMFGYHLSSDVASDTVVELLDARVMFSGSGDYSSDVESSGAMDAEALTPFLLPAFNGSSDVESSTTVLPGTVGTAGVRLEPYTSNIDENGTYTMGSEANLTLEEHTDGLSSEWSFHLSGEFAVYCEGQTDLSSASGFNGDGLSAVGAANGETSDLTLVSLIDMTIAPAWIYPVQSGDDLYVVQAKEITAAGVQLTIG